MKRLTLIFAVIVFALLAVAQVGAGNTDSSFEAVFNGSTGATIKVGNSLNVLVLESGSGNEQTFGPFVYEATLLQNTSVRRIPVGCAPGTTVGLSGKAVLGFANGQLNLKQLSGTNCSDPPDVNVDEEWTISSGTGAFVGASGKLTRQYGASMITRSAGGTLTGTIRLP